MVGVRYRDTTPTYIKILKQNIKKMHVMLNPAIFLQKLGSLACELLVKYKGRGVVGAQRGATQP